MATVITDIKGERFVDTIKRSDGKNALVVDTELTLNGDVHIDNIQVGSTTGTEANTFLKTESNGILINKLVNTSDVKINPATYDAQTDGSQQTQLVSATGEVVDVEQHDGANGLVVCTPDIYVEGDLDSLDDTVENNVHGQGSTIMNVSGTWTGKIIFEGSVDGGTTWTALSMVQPGGAITFNGVQNDHQNGNYRVCITSGYKKLRARMSSFTSGSAHIKINASQPVGTNFVFQLNEENLNANTNPYMIDEFGVKARWLGDNIFQGVAISIPIEHHEIHCGDSYECFHLTTLGSGAVLNVLIVVPEKKPEGADWRTAQDWLQYHLKGVVETQAECTIEFFEGATTSADGTALSCFNRNRNSDFTSDLTLFHTPTITGTGTRLVWKKGGSGRVLGASVSREEEFILKDNTKYLLRVTNDINQNNWVNVELEYYIHPGI